MFENEIIFTNEGVVSEATVVKLSAMTELRPSVYSVDGTPLLVILGYDMEDKDLIDSIWLSTLVSLLVKNVVIDNKGIFSLLINVIAFETCIRPSLDINEYLVYDYLNAFKHSLQLDNINKYIEDDRYDLLNVGINFTKDKDFSYMIVSVARE